MEYLGQTIKTLISEESMQSELFQKIEEGVRKYKEWEAGREEREPSSVMEFPTNEWKS